MTTRHVYFDAEPVVSWAQGEAGDVDRLAMASAVAELVEDASVVTALSEVTLVEIIDVLCKLLRDTRESTAHYDESWFDSSQDRLMRWLSDGCLLVLPTPPKLYEMALRLVEMATREHGRRFKAWDAAHVYLASVWARETGQRVQLVTADHDFTSFFELYPLCGDYVELISLP